MGLCRKKMIPFLFLAGCTGLMLVFFLRVHPLVIFDADDWTYISYSRTLFPSLKEYNPARVFPEISQGVLAEIGVHFIYPLTHDYVGSISLVYGIVLCLFILLYLYEFYRFVMYTNPNIGTLTACLITGMFLLFHFSVFKKEASNNDYLLRARDMNCYFYYTIPNLMNAALTLFLLRNHFKVSVRNHFTRAVLLIICGYFCIYSNIFMTGILMSAVGLDLLYELAAMIARKLNIREVLQSRWYSFLLTAFWIIMLLFESRGRRARAVGGELHIYDSIRVYMGWVHSFNYLTMMVALASIIFGVSVIVSKKWKKRCQKPIKLAAFLIGAFLIESMFLILLCGKAGSRYMQRSDTVFGIAFYGFLVVFTFLAVFLTAFPKAITVYAIFTTLLILNIGYGKNIFMESTIRNVKPAQAKMVDEDLINQICSASQRGETHMTLYVPKGNDYDNWPHAYYLGARMSRTLVRHGVISHEMDILIQPDPEMNVKYNLGYTR